jgi:uridine kinase
MGSKSVDEVLDPAAAAAAGVHLSALRLDGLNRIQGSASSEEQPTTSGLENGHQEPFVIHGHLSTCLPAPRLLVQ